MFMTAEQVDAQIQNEMRRYADQVNGLTAQLNALRPVVVQPYQAVRINPDIDSGTTSLDLIKSLPEFSGDSSSYPAWRSAASFAMDYYPVGSEKFYVATGILRNKITQSANTTLSAFNTVLNFRAIIERLDQSYSDKRPIHVLESQLSILRQDNLSITEFYETVDKQLTLILNKQIMSYQGQDNLVAALNERARENALRVFVSGLRRPFCDILFSSQPRDLPSALATAQELETNKKRHEFARIFAAGNTIRLPKMPNYSQSFNQSVPKNNATPMDVDPSMIVSRSNSNNFQQHRSQPNVSGNRYQNPNIAGPSAVPQNQNAKRYRDYSERFQANKFQRVNHISTENQSDEAINESNSESDFEPVSDIEAEENDNVHFLD